MYGLKQAPRAWYDCLFEYILSNNYRRGAIDKTLFIQEVDHDILVVQVYVDDIIFGATNMDLVERFKDVMSNKFNMSLIGELNFFMGLHVTQKEDGIQVHQQKYLCEILTKYHMDSAKTFATPIS